MSCRLTLLLLCLVSAPLWADGDRHRVAIVAQNAGTEITDLLVPFALLSAAGRFDVEILATGPGTVSLWPALAVTPHAQLQERSGPPPDLVIVPAVHDHEDPALHGWLREQQRRGAMLASICDGALVLGAAGLLDGRAATGHFYSDSRRRRDYPQVHWQSDRRWVEDGAVLSSAGVSASAPATLRLIERFAGTATADAVAAEYGIDGWSDEHDSDRFRIGAREIWLVIRNWLLGLNRHEYRLAGGADVDEYALAFTTDLLARTSRARIGPDAGQSLTTRFGLVLTGEPVRDAEARTIHLPSVPVPSVQSPAVNKEAPGNPDTLTIANPGDAIRNTLAHIAAVYGEPTARFVAVQLELPAPMALPIPDAALTSNGPAAPAFPGAVPAKELHP